MASASPSAALPPSKEGGSQQPPWYCLRLDVDRRQPESPCFLLSRLRICIGLCDNKSNDWTGATCVNIFVDLPFVISMGAKKMIAENKIVFIGNSRVRAVGRIVHTFVFKALVSALVLIIAWSQLHKFCLLLRRRFVFQRSIRSWYLFEKICDWHLRSFLWGWWTKGWIRRVAEGWKNCKPKEGNKERAVSWRQWTFDYLVYVRFWES